MYMDHDERLRGECTDNALAQLQSCTGARDVHRISTLWTHALNLAKGISPQKRNSTTIIILIWQSDPDVTIFKISGK